MTKVADGGYGEIDRSRVILGRWINHKSEQVQQLRLWAGKAKVLGKTDIASRIIEPAEILEKANNPSKRALEKICRMRSGHGNQTP